MSIQFQKFILATSVVHNWRSTAIMLLLLLLYLSSWLWRGLWGCVAAAHKRDFKTHSCFSNASGMFAFEITCRNLTKSICSSSCCRCCAWYYRCRRRRRHRHRLDIIADDGNFRFGLNSGWRQQSTLSWSWSWWRSGFGTESLYSLACAAQPQVCVHRLLRQTPSFIAIRCWEAVGAFPVFVCMLNVRVRVTCEEHDFT